MPSNGLLSFFVFSDYRSGDIPFGKVIFTADVSKLQRRNPNTPLVDGNELAPECELEFEETLDMPFASTYNLDQSDADRLIGCRRARRLGLTIDHTNTYGQLRKALMPDREGRSHLLGWSHPNVASGDPIDEDSRNLLTVASEESCEWCWVDEYQLYYGISNGDLAAQKFDRVTAIDG